MEDTFHPPTNYPPKWETAWGAFNLLKEKQPACVGLIIERSLEVKLPTIWTDGKADVGRVREEKRREEERRSEKRKSQKTEGAGARKGSKAAKHCVFPMIYGSGGSKNMLAKAAGAEPSGQIRDEKLNPVVARSTYEVKMCKTHQVRSTLLLEVEMSKKCTPLWREAHFQVKMYKAHHSRTTFGSWDVEKVGGKHISKSKCIKHTILRPLLEVEMLKKCTPLWLEAHFQVKMLKAPHVRTTFGRSDVVSCGRRKRLCTLSTVSETLGFCSSFNYNHLHSTPLHSTPLHYTTTTTTTTTTITTTRHNTTLHYPTLQYTRLITLHFTTPHHTTLHYTNY